MGPVKEKSLRIPLHPPYAPERKNARVTTPILNALAGLDVRPVIRAGQQCLEEGFGRNTRTPWLASDGGVNETASGQAQRGNRAPEGSGGTCPVTKTHVVLLLVGFAVDDMVSEIIYAPRCDRQDQMQCSQTKAATCFTKAMVSHATA